jgi:hypothetical protein
MIPIHTTRSRVRQKWCLNRVKFYCKMSIIVYLHNPPVQNSTMTSNPRPTFTALLVQTPAPSIAPDGDIGPPMADRPHLHLCTLLNLPHHHRQRRCWCTDCHTWSHCCCRGWDCNWHWTGKNSLPVSGAADAAVLAVVAAAAAAAAAATLASRWAGAEYPSWCPTGPRNPQLSPSAGKTTHIKWR